MCDDLVGLFDHAANALTLEPGQVLFHEGDDGRHVHRQVG